MDNLIVLKEEVKGKTITYYKSNGRSGKGYLKKNGWTKKREQKQEIEANKTKNNEPEQKEEVLISVARIKGARSLQGEYYYDMRIILYTTNSFDHVTEQQEIYFQDKRYNSSII